MANYKLSYKLHLPTDKPWRETPEDVKREVKANDPLALWRSVIIEVTNQLQLSHDIGFFVGLMCNLINPFPADVRAAIVKGVNAGFGLNLIAEGDEIVGSLDPTFDPLPTISPTGQREKRTASGLIIP